MSKFKSWSIDELCEIVEKNIDRTQIGKILSVKMRNTFVAEHRVDRERLEACVEYIDNELHLNLRVNSNAESTTISKLQ
jgi:hypothetical protein